MSKRWFGAALAACTLALALVPARADSGREGFWGLGLDQQGALGCLHCRLLWLESVHSGQPGEEQRWNPGSGQDLRNYAPDRPVDFAHMRLTLDIPDMNTPRLTGVAELDFTPIGRPLTVLPLNAVGMTIDGVELAAGGEPGAGVRYAYDESVLSVRFDPPVPAGRASKLRVRYRLDDPAEGLFWTPESPAWPGRPAQIHTQGQPETNRYWFPAHDSPNERLTTEIIATVPEGFLVSANGRLVSSETKGGRTTWHWLQDKDHVSYLVTLVVGKFDVVDVAPKGARVPLPVFVPPGKGPLVQGTFGNTQAILETFEKRFGVPYPWDRYANLVVHNFGAGGMENTSATTLYDTAILDSRALLDGDLDGLNSHELAHQWFGDLITCKTWAHIWLNEGWATYATGLWFEQRDGYDKGYLDYVYGLRGVATNDQMSPDGGDWRPGMVSPVYEHPWEVFRRVSNPYPKGASILHMLRMKLGDELFFRATGEYVRRFAHKTVETDDFRRVYEEVSGLSLEHFFEQWCRRPGTPRLNVEASWNEERKELSLVVEQRQRISPDLPAFAFDLPVFIETPAAAAGAEARTQTVTIPVAGRRHERVIPLDVEPTMVAVDPSCAVLSEMTIEQPARRWIEQARRGPTVAARHDAARALGRFRSAETAEALRSIAADRSAHFRTRQHAADSLGRQSRADLLVSLLRSDAAGGGPDGAKVRLALVQALGVAAAAAKPGDALETLAQIAAEEGESYAPRAAAVAELGKLTAPGTPAFADHLKIIQTALGATSQHDHVRQAALRALASVDTKESLVLAIPSTRPGNLNRTRPIAIETVGKLAHHDLDAALAALTPLTEDREQRARRAVASALVDIADPRALPLMDRIVRFERDAAERQAAAEARDRLAAAIDKARSREADRTEIERLRRDLERLKDQVDKR
ncbi:MAG: HEAT repeat domain-containing protein [Phycisphaerales bacterium]|nr:HEAT repeat domain-containing protein [Phycisphaerales bacterium]